MSSAFDSQRAVAQGIHPAVVSAHVMGGCAFGEDTRRSAVDRNGRYHHLDNLYVLDGSLFPTSIGANPQLSIYAIVARLASGLVTAIRA